MCANHGHAFGEAVESSGYSTWALQSAWDLALVSLFPSSMVLGKSFIFSVPPFPYL